MQTIISCEKMTHRNDRQVGYLPETCERLLVCLSKQHQVFPVGLSIPKNWE